MISLDIAMLVGGLPFDGDTFKKGSLGGSESAGLYMAKELSKLGHNVKMFCNTPTGKISRDEDSVEYYPIGLWQQYAKWTPHDVSIIQRQPQAFSMRYNSKLNLLWQHDLAMGRESKEFRGAMWNIDKVIVLSDFHRRQYMEVLSLPESSFWTSRNGIDLSLFDELRKDHIISRHPKRIIYAARPERGLDVLLRETMPRLLAIDPGIELRIAGYNNPVEHMQPFYSHCKQLADQLGDRVKWLGHLTKEELYREYMSARVYVYPTPSQFAARFREISCISSMEAQAAGLPIVTSANGALPETIHPEAGRLIPGDPWTPEYQDQFAAAVIDLITDDVAWRAAQVNGVAHANALGWDRLAKEWSDKFFELIDENNENKDRLFRHFWRQSDIVACRELYSRNPEANPEWEQMLTPFEFAWTREGMREQYAKIATTHGPDIFDYASREPRLKLEMEFLETNPELKTVLDYGCGTGGYPGLVAERFKDRNVIGIDIDPKTIEMATEGCRTRGITNVRFIAAEHDQLAGLDLPLADCAVLQEVLEHVAEPWKVLESVERQVRKDGWVYVTVPMGPWEYSSYHNYPHRCHIWHFDNHDLHDMLGEKPGLYVTTHYHMDSPELGDPMGWWIISYKADHEPIGTINLNRKLRIQRPRQTVSVSMIMGGEHAEDTVHWCLKSLRHVADEVVVADCGMSEEARRELLQHPGVKLLEGAPNPREHGFDVARNVSLAHCQMDWVFWVDADEKLIAQGNVNKYLRSNVFDGYGIRQHHFACDTQFTPDMPVRFFRRKPRADGMKVQFYGSIHEHPEYGLNGGPGQIIVLTDTHIAHVGYLNEDIRQRRFMRNFPLLQMDIRKYPERLLQKFFIMRDNSVLIREALNANGGRVDKAIREKCLETINVYRENFLGKTTYANTDATPIYSEALRVLNEGFEVSFSFAVDKSGTPNSNSVTQLRYANRDDMKKDLERRMNEIIGNIDSEMY